MKAVQTGTPIVPRSSLSKLSESVFGSGFPVFIKNGLTFLTIKPIFFASKPTSSLYILKKQSSENMGNLSRCLGKSHGSEVSCFSREWGEANSEGGLWGLHFSACHDRRAAEVWNTVESTVFYF